MSTRHFLILLAATAFAWASAAEREPKDVRDFVDRRELCEHMSGEIPDPSDKERLNEIIEQVNKLCRNIDDELFSLRKKYSRDPVVMNRLSQFEYLEPRKMERKTKG